MGVSEKVNHVLKNAAVLLSGSLGSNALTFLSLVIFAKSVGVDSFGYYVLIATYVELVNKIFNFQTWQAFIKYAVDFESHSKIRIKMLLKYCFVVDNASLFLSFFVAIALANYFLVFFDVPAEYKEVLLILSVSLLFNAAALSVGIFRHFDLFWIQSKILIGVSVVRVLVFGGVALWCPEVINFAYAILFCGFLSATISFIYVVRELYSRGYYISEIVKTRLDWQFLKKHNVFSFVAYINLDATVRVFSRQLDVLVLGKLFGSEIVALYKIAKEISNVISKLIDPVYQAIYPEFSRLLGSGKAHEAKGVAKTISIYVTLAGALFYFAFILLGKFVLVLFFGDAFGDAYFIVLVYFIGIYMAMVSLPLVPALLANGNAKPAFLNQVIATGIYGVVLYPLVIYFPLIGAAISYVVFYISWVALTLLTISRNKVFD
ncbi:lipopolysaccharide biosynthesis protein [Stutzerimonas stutzeri]|uniref:lipopolysaccharide biosynthesis protein n=1 Tax=Stutzerimonas stutzeri TaxID=316 RepID=UPI003C2FC4DB